LVFPDADLEATADAIVRGMNFTRNQGQSCGATTRLLVHRDVHDQVVDMVVDRVRKIRLGLPELETTEMGSMISREHRQRSMDAIEDAVGRGARLLVGGGVPDDAELAGGAYLEPTVLGDVTPEMVAFREEQFGPVLAIT